VPAGTEIVRVGIDNLGTTEPSASSAPRRFSPVHDVAGAPVPVLYAGDSLGCALGETVFHDLPDDPSVPATILRADLVSLRAGFISLERDLQLLDLTDDSLRAQHLSRADIIATPPGEYARTAVWGQKGWDAGRAAGIVWNSRRSGDRLAYMLFVDPPRHEDAPHAADRRADLTVQRPPLPLYDGIGLGEVLVAATERNVTVIF
jgi:hypothetical protein